MTDERPRPQFGEYASAEEQRARIRQPDVTERLDAGVAPAGAESAAAAQVAPITGATATPPGRGRLVDRIVAFALLAYGLVNVVSAAPALVDYAAYMTSVFELMGVDAEIGDADAGQPWGIAAAVVLIGGWLLTAAVSWATMRRGRVSWWIPLVGGVVFSLIAGALVMIPLMSDTALWSSLMGAAGP
ncbi:DUF6264 family protein [Microbacterium aurantiacum]|uniref:Uncharacterized protein n=1 Tax=Microbacterium aurantiacum TaxID=162393 RepID=A0ABT8FSC0_9MICO|nr:DUF6264 family protein [Microbacterium aurantiacum]MDN4464213.1 hypothetical protein [Microbacterium aurantiacum]